MSIFNKIRLRKLPKGLAFCIFTVILALIILLLEFIKVHSVYLYGLSFNQLVAFLMLIAVIKPLFDRVKLIISMKRGNK